MSLKLSNLVLTSVSGPPQPFPSWTIGAPDWTWKAPVQEPTDGSRYNWDESTKTWVKVADGS